MKRSNLVVLAGGLLAAVAVFLPFFLSQPGAGLFGPGTSQLKALQIAFSPQRFRFVPTLFLLMEEASLLFEPLGAVLLLISGVLAFRLGRSALVLGVIGGVLSLTYIIWVTLFDSLATFSAGHGLDVGKTAQLLGIGWWLATIGSVLGWMGALLGWLRQSPAQGIPAGGRVFRFSASALLLAAGGLALLIGFFFPFHSWLLKESLFDLLLLPGYPYILWPDLLAMLLLVVSGVIAFTGRKGAYLGGLIGALVGAAFLVLFTGFIIYAASVLPELQPKPGYWLMVAGCVLGLVGALLGLLEHPAAPVPVQVQAAPGQF